MGGVYYIFSYCPQICIVVHYFVANFFLRIFYHFLKSNFSEIFYDFFEDFLRLFREFFFSTKFFFLEKFCFWIFKSNGKGVIQRKMHLFILYLTSGYHIDLVPKEKEHPFALRLAFRLCFCPQAPCLPSG